MDTGDRGKGFSKANKKTGFSAVTQLKIRQTAPNASCTRPGIFIFFNLSGLVLDSIVVPLSCLCLVF